MLITRIKAANFYGIKDPIDITFVEGGEKEKIGYVKKDRRRVALISGFYGANASGKSTVLNVIDTIVRIMLTKHPESPLGINGIKQDTIINILPNYHVTMQSKPIEIEIDFIVEQNEYNYSVSISNDLKEISKEVLYKNNKPIFNRGNNTINFDPIVSKNLGALAHDITPPKKSSFLSVILDDSSDVSVFGNLKEEIGISELKQIENKVCFITDKRSIQMGQNNVNGLIAFALNYLNSDKKTADSKISTVNSVVKYFEPSFEKLNIEKIGDSSTNNNQFGSSFPIKYEAKYSNFYRELGIMELSGGTREIISFISDILRMIKTGGIVIYDETSKYYHPDMEIAILNLFKDKDINRNNAQIFFSSHNHETFDLLQNDQAHIVEKRDDSIIVSKVSDYNVKERDNIKRIYRLGSLGGVPNTIDFSRIINNLL
jgi:uncharacterized protein